ERLDHAFRRTGGQHAQRRHAVAHRSTRAPEIFTMRAHLTMSSSRNRRNSSGVIVIVVAPCFAHSDFVSGRETIFVISVFSRFTIAGGVSFGAIRPSQM